MQEVLGTLRFCIPHKSRDRLVLVCGTHSGVRVSGAFQNGEPWGITRAAVRKGQEPLPTPEQVSLLQDSSEPSPCCCEQGVKYGVPTSSWEHHGAPFSRTGEARTADTGHSHAALRDSAWVYNSPGLRGQTSLL